MIHNYMNPTKIFDSYLLKQLDVNSTKLYTCNNMEFYCTIFILVQITAQSHYSTLCLPVGVGQLRKISDRVRIALEDTCQGQDNLGRYPLRLGQHMFKNILLTLFRINVKFVGQKTSLFGIFILIFCLDFFFSDILSKYLARNIKDISLHRIRRAFQCLVSRSSIPFS